MHQQFISIVLPPHSISTSARSVTSTWMISSYGPTWLKNMLCTSVWSWTPFEQPSSIVTLRNVPFSYWNLIFWDTTFHSVVSKLMTPRSTAFWIGPLQSLQKMCEPFWALSTTSQFTCPSLLTTPLSSLLLPRSVHELNSRHGVMHTSRLLMVSNDWL